MHRGAIGEDCSLDLIEACERGWIPDPLARAGMRRLMARRLEDEACSDHEQRVSRMQDFLAELRAAPIAVHTDDANAQHYEVPAAFFHQHLGPRLKYSCCLYPSDGESLAEAEEAMLALWLAEHYPGAEVVGLSNSNGQREWILAQASARGLSNLAIVTADINDADFPMAGVAGGFDRVLSIEMFEHMKNYGLLLAKLRSWLRDVDSRLFVHIFANPLLAYPFEDRARDDWMTRYFFTGGTMPSENLLLHFLDDMQLLQQWWVDGRHYERTANHWLAGMDANRDAILASFADSDYRTESAIWFQRWRMFYMAVAEFFGNEQGQQWGVAHYLLGPRR